VRILVPFPPGGATDILARIMALRLSESLGQQFFVDNRPGASGNIAMGMAAKSAPDGYTVLFASSVFVVNPSLYAKPAYDPVQGLRPDHLPGRRPNALIVNPGFPPKTVQELIVLVRDNPGKYGFASPGNGTTPHLAGELFKMANKLDLLSVPFAGASPAIQSVLQGQTPMAFMALANATELLKAGNLRALATTGRQRSAILPDVPTMTDAGIPGQEVGHLAVRAGAAGTPRPIIDRLHAETVRIMALPDVRTQLAGLAFDATVNTPEQAAVQI